MVELNMKKIKKFLSNLFKRKITHEKIKINTTWRDDPNVLSNRRYY